ncbi:hypothetical protein ACB092_05G150000 [Castanea dentata]
MLAVITRGLDSKLIMWDFSKGRPYKIVDFVCSCRKLMRPSGHPMSAVSYPICLGSGVFFGNMLSFPPILFCSLAGNWCLNRGCSSIHALITLRLWPENGCREYLRWTNVFQIFVRLLSLMVLSLIHLNLDFCLLIS